MSWAPRFASTSRSRSRAGALLLLQALAMFAVLAVAACSGPSPSLDGRAEEGPLGRVFAASAAEAKVPRDLLVAIARVEDGLEIPARRPGLHADAEVPAAGPLMLRRGQLDTLARGAALVSATELELREDADLALRAGALVLSSLPHGDDLASWERALEELSGYADPSHRQAYAHRVFATLARGGRFTARDGEVIDLPARDLPPSLTTVVDTQLRTLGNAQFPGAEWIPTSCTNKCAAGRGGNDISFVVIHDTEGGWDASVATLQNDPQKSVQYIIGTDGRVAQFVTEETTAWHAGNRWYNQRSVGVEHVGYKTKPYTEKQYAASAKLVDYLATKYAIPRDRAHVIGHDQIPDGGTIAESSPPCALSPKDCTSGTKYGGASNHDDPGVWEWASYMPRIGGEAKCTDVTSLLTCSNDKTQAFRCVAAAGKVELRTCESACVPGGKGLDATCVAKPTSVPPKTTPTVDPPPVQESTSAVLPAPADEPPAVTSDDAGGCSTSGHTRSGSLVLVALAMWLISRRRMS